VGEFDPPAVAALRRIYRALAGPETISSYWLTRKLLLRSLGFVYLIAFAVAVVQLVPLLGNVGLTPVEAWLDRLAGHHGSRSAAFWEVPTLLWFDHSDTSLRAIAIAGLVISVLVVLGLENAFAFLLLWILYISIVHVGQRWYSFGWEFQLLETGFIALFWCPWLALRMRPSDAHGPSRVPLWLYRWLIVRIMLGAGLIKLRGDPCWTELSCLDTHFATQPIPGPLSPWFHALPGWALAGGVLLNHLAELVAPLFVFGPRRVRHVAGVIIIGFQVALIVSGNLAFLNWLTMIPALACFDDQLLRRLLPSRWRARVPEVVERPPRKASHWAALAFAALVAALSLPVVANLLGRDQAMNKSYGRLHLVNTYGAFGSVGEERLELIVEGTDAEDPNDPDAIWQAYEFKCKPGAVDRRPCWITPYHLRLDWLAWFAALEVQHQGGLDREDWLLHLIYKLLHGDPVARSLLARDNPFADAPPRWIRVHVYEYRLAAPGGDVTWERESLGELISPIAADDPRLVDYLRRRGWLTDTARDSSSDRR
jgi:hypothetical protein